MLPRLLLRLPSLLHRVAWPENGKCQQRRCRRSFRNSNNPLRDFWYVCLRENTKAIIPAKVFAAPQVKYAIVILDLAEILLMGEQPNP